MQYSNSQCPKTSLTRNFCSNKTAIDTHINVKIINHELSQSLNCQYKIQLTDDSFKSNI